MALERSILSPPSLDHKCASIHGILTMVGSGIAGSRKEVVGMDGNYCVFT